MTIEKINLLGFYYNPRETLVDSSKTTLRWLERITAEIKKKIPSIVYDESKYYALFKSTENKSNIVALHLQKTQIRLFLKLPVYQDDDLDLTISSGTWAIYYPSMYILRSEKEIEKSIELIVKSYEYDVNP